MSITRHKCVNRVLASICSKNSLYSSGKALHQVWNIAQDSATRAIVRSGTAVKLHYQLMKHIFFLCDEAFLSETWHQGISELAECGHLMLGGGRWK